MVYIERTEQIRSDLPPLKKKDPQDPKRKLTVHRYQEGPVVTTLEFLSCGHMVNLGLNGKPDGKGGTLIRKSGVCPKGCA